MTLLSVPDMTCGHCSASVESALTDLPGADAVEIDLPARHVRVKGEIAPEALIAVLDEIGFPATLVDVG
jgi:copper chaperone